MAKMAICDFAGHLRKRASHGKGIAHPATVWFARWFAAKPVGLHGWFAEEPLVCTIGLQQTPLVCTVGLQ
jgi:hypothetical protein